MTSWAIETRALTKDFGGNRAVDHLDLTVPEGCVFGLMGPNGAGKSTIIRMLMGIVRPTRGAGFLLGKDVGDPLGAVRQPVGYVSDVQHMYPWFRVEEVLEFCSGVYPNWDWNRCGTLLQTFAIPTRKRVQALSEGMKTQLSLIIALSVRPRLLILDEPTRNLDPVVKHHFMQLILEEAAASGVTVFFSTNNLHELERMADQVAVVLHGRMLFNRSMDTLKASTRKIQAVFPEGLPEDIAALPDVLRVETTGKVYSIIVGDRFADVFDRVKSHHPVFVEALDISLEEFFIHTMKKEGYGHEVALPE